MKKKSSKSEEASVKSTPLPSSLNMLGFISNPSTVTVTVVAEKVQAFLGPEAKVIKMESGRMAAQVGHAVSKLKLLYLEQLVRLNPQYTNMYMSNLAETPITSIILKARDQNELYHIGQLCEDKCIPYTYFSDKNKQFYGTFEDICTAISIGPISKDKLRGITDYLPLWKDDSNL